MNLVIVILFLGIMATLGYVRTRHIVNNIEKKGDKHDQKSES